MDTVRDTLAATHVGKTVAEWLATYQTGVGIIVSVLLTLCVFWLNWKKEQRAAEKRFAVAWRTALEELWFALDRMYEMSRQFLAKKVPNSEIALFPSVTQAFFASPLDLKAGQTIMRIHQTLHQFVFNVRNAHEFKRQLGYLAMTDPVAHFTMNESMWRYVGSALWFATHRHHKMVDLFFECDQSYRSYCTQRDINPGEAFPEIQKLPPEHQKDE